MKFGSTFLVESSKEKLINFDIERYSNDEILVCDHLNIIEILNLFDESPLSYSIEPSVFEGEGIAIFEVPAKSFEYLFKHKNFFDEYYQDDLTELEKFHSRCGSGTLFEVSTW